MKKIKKLAIPAEGVVVIRPLKNKSIPHYFSNKFKGFFRDIGLVGSNIKLIIKYLFVFVIIFLIFLGITSFILKLTFPMNYTIALSVSGYIFAVIYLITIPKKF